MNGRVLSSWLVAGLVAGCGSNAGPTVGGGVLVEDTGPDVAVFEPGDDVQAADSEATARDTTADSASATTDGAHHDAAGDADTGAEPADLGPPVDTNGPVDTGVVKPPVDSDKDGVPDNLDCAPNDKSRHPGANEACNNKDDDCDGQTDEGVKNKCGKCGPVPKEVCNGKDDDCDGKTDEGLNCGLSGPKVCYPGVNNAYKTCFKLTPRSQVKVAGYVWPKHSSKQYASPKNVLDLTKAPASTKVAKNFTLGELMQASKGKYGVFSAKTVARLQAVRNKLGVPLHINSAFRSPGYNKKVPGAATYSRHQYGDAADMTTKGKTSLSAIVNACKVNGAGFTKLYSSHVHCDWRNDKLGHDFWP